MRSINTKTKQLKSAILYFYKFAVSQTCGHSDSLPFRFAVTQQMRSINTKTKRLKSAILYIYGVAVTQTCGYSDSLLYQHKDEAIEECDTLFL